MRVSEYDAFGPWAYEIDEDHPLPPLFVPWVEHPEDYRMLFKLPRDIERRKATPDMDLYDYVVGVNDEGIRVWSRREKAVDTAYLPFREIGDFFRDCRLGIEQEASNSWAWNRLIYTYRWAAKQLEPEYISQFVDGVVETADYLDAFNEGRMGPIELDQTEEQFLAFCRVLQGRREEVIYENMQKYLENATFN